MAAAYDATYANKKAFFRNLKRVNAYDKNVKYDPTGVFAFSTGAKAIATTNIDDIGDAVFFLQFPSNSYLINLQYTWTDVAASALVWNGVTSTTGASGGTEVVLISGSTVGSAAGSDELDINTGHFLRDVSGLYVGYKVTTAAVTPAAGTVTVKGLIYIGDIVTGF